MPAQVARLAAWYGALRWLADVPRDVCARLVVELDKAWQRCFAKLGAVRAVVHRAVGGRAKTCALVCDGDAWVACIAHEREVPPPAPSTQPPVGIDRGVANLLADSDGGFVENSRPLQKVREKLARAQRAGARKQKGSQNQQRARARTATLHQKGEIECVACGHRDHADTNAARVLLRRGMRGAEGCGGDGTARPAKQHLRVVRRGTRFDPGALVVTTKAPGFGPG